MRAALGVVLLIAGCSQPNPNFVCTGHASCRDGDRQGICEESGFCSFEDVDCPELRRYGVAAPASIAEQCVDLGESPLGTWKDEDQLPVSRYSHATVTDGNSIYALGGIAGSTERSDSWGARLSPGGFGGIEAWVEGASMPSSRRSFGAAIHGGFVYAIAGRTSDTTESEDVLASPIDSNGILGPWTASSPLPGGIRCHSVVQSGNQVYVVGGKANGAGAVDVVIGTMANGAIEWRPGSKMTSPRFCHSAVVAGGYLYAIGGCPAGSTGCPGRDLTDDVTASVEFAKIEADGSLGPFQPTTPLPAERWHHTAAGNAHYVVVVGGHTKTEGNTSTVLVTHVNPDGSLGPWRESAAFPRGSSRENALVIGEQMFVIASETRVASLRLAPLVP